MRIILERRLGFLTHYPYFNTPLTDTRPLLEAINNHYLTNGKSYFLDTNAINQPLCLIRLYHSLYSLTHSDTPIHFFLFACDIYTTLLICHLFTFLYPKSKDGKKIRIMQLLMIFNPLSLISPAVHNLQIVNHMMIASVVYSVLKWRFEGLKSDVVCGVALYIDPSLVYVVVPVRVVENLIKNRSLIGGPVFKSLAVWGSVFATILITASGDW